MSRYPSHRTFTRRRSGLGNFGPIVAFLLIASFGILFAGCSPVRGPTTEEMTDTTFTAEDLATFNSLAGTGAVKSGTGATAPLEDLSDFSEADLGPPADPTLINLYTSLRAPTNTGDPNLFHVTNEFVNVRSAANTNAPSVARLTQGEPVTVISFVDAAWAKVKMAGGQEGYLSSRYIARKTSDEKIAAEKKKYEGVYFVNFTFVNVRAGRDVSTEKIGQIPGQALVRPLSVDADWAKVTVDGKEGYASMQFLKPFIPTFLTRQETYKLPILLYHAGQEGSITQITDHAAALRAAGYKLMSLKGFYDLLLSQEQRDVRLSEKAVVIGIAGVTPGNVKTLSTALYGANIPATFFVETKDVGIGGITEKTLLTLVANGFDVASATHTGDDLRGLTSAQVRLELRQSKALLEEMTQRTVLSVLYPMGGVNDRVTQMAEAAGYLFGVSTVPSNTFGRDEMLRLPSVAVTSAMTVDDLMRAVK